MILPTEHGPCELLAYELHTDGAHGFVTLRLKPVAPLRCSCGWRGHPHQLKTFALLTTTVEGCPDCGREVTSATYTN